MTMSHEKRVRQLTFLNTTLLNAHWKRQGVKTRNLFLIFLEAIDFKSFSKRNRYFFSNLKVHQALTLPFYQRTFPVHNVETEDDPKNRSF